MSVPNAPISLTIRQMATLKEFLQHIGVEDYSLELSPGVEEGENFGGVIINSKIKWSNSSGESSSHYVIKSTPPGNVYDTMVPLQDSFLREIYIYSMVFPEFEKIQDEHNILNPFKPYPTFYTSLTTTEEKMLVLQNMKVLEFSHRNRHQPLDYEHILLVVKRYAQLHALSYAIRHHKPHLNDEIEKNTADHFLSKFEYDGIRSVSQHRIGNALKALDPVEDKVIYDKLFYFYENACPILTNLINSKNQYQVISHIDCGIPNFLFKYDHVSNAPIDVSILDWQHTRSDSPAVDLITFIFSSSSKITRERYEELILEYHKCLCSFLEQLQCDGDKMLPFRVLQNELKVYGIVGLYAAISLIYVFSTSGQKLPNVLSDESHEKGFSFVFDLQDRTEFDKRVRDAIIDFHKLGYNFK